MPIQNISEKVCQNLGFVFCDIDDTLTLDGKLPAAAYQAMWQLHNAGIKIIPITGRPAGWVDHIARMWPVDAVIGENGAFYFWMENHKINRFYLQRAQERETNRIRLNQIAAEVLDAIPQAAIAADQPFRETDLAIDFCEDIPRLTDKQIDQIVNIFTKHGAQAKISSIHVNGWFGEFHKFSTLQVLLKNQWQMDFLRIQENCLFIGDSPNDEPIFKEFTHSVGVANIQQFISRMQYLPHYVTHKAGGLGFAEMTEIILAKKNGN